MKWKPIAIGLLALAFGAGAASAQTCPPVAATLEALATTCANIVRGEICADGTPIPVAGLGGFAVEMGALAKVQSSYPDVAPDEFVSLAFVGSVQVRPVVEVIPPDLPIRLPVEVTLTSGKANVRPQPARVGKEIAQFIDGIQLNATGISKGAFWIRVQLPDQPDQPAWMSRTVIHSEYDLNLLPVVTGDDPIPQYPEFTPMQALSIVSGNPCSGLVVQSGDELGKMQVNGVALELHDATAFVQAMDGALTIQVLEGLVQVQAQDMTTVSVAGSMVRVPLDATGQPSAAPESPAAYDSALVGWVAGSYVQRPVSAPPSADNVSIQNSLVTPLSGVWEIEYPEPYTYVSEEGPTCGEVKVKGPTQLFDIFVASDGSSFSAFNPDTNIGAAVRVLPGLYELRDFSFKVLSPTEMTATYDTNPLASCTSIITINARWMHSGN